MASLFFKLFKTFLNLYQVLSQFYIETHGALQILTNPTTNKRYSHEKNSNLYSVCFSVH